MNGEPFLFSHIMLWTVGGLTAVGLVVAVGAIWSMGRQAYRKD